MKKMKGSGLALKRKGKSQSQGKRTKLEEVFIEKKTRNNAVF